MSNEFDDLVDEFKMVEIIDKNGDKKNIKVAIIAKESGRLSLCMKNVMTQEDADRITDIMKSAIKRPNPTMTEPQSDAIVALNFSGLFEQFMLLCNPNITKEQIEKAKNKIKDEESEKND